jgi:formylglycine-generating enzyme
MKKAFVVMAVLVLMCPGGIAQAVTISTVAVDNTNNAADTRYDDFGSVGYSYNIGAYEVTAGQYAEFLNAKAKTDTYGLYNALMWSSAYGCKIQQISHGASGYIYAVTSEWANRPVNFVSFWDACRFSNWLHNGQGTGDTETGAYTLTPGGIATNTVTRSTGWKWAVTSENEWYKAAYYDPNKAGGAGYWDYPTRSYTAPGNQVADPDPGNQANYYINNYSIDSPYYRTNAGEFENSASAYGTYDQGGNVWEWNEGDALARGLRGGAWANNDPIFLHASNYTHYFGPTTEGYLIGFRVSQAVPEPSSMIALAGGLVSLLGMRRRRA